MHTRNSCLLTAWLALALVGLPIPASAAGEAYTPVVIEVTCDGTGTRLQEALDGLNPLADVYDIQVRGTCPEPLVIDKFQSLHLSSSDPPARASIGKVYVRTGAQNVYLSHLDLVDTGAFLLDAQSHSVTAGNNRLEMNDVRLFCELADGAYNKFCRGISKIGGDGLFYHVTFAGTGWTEGKVIRMVRGAALVYAYEKNSEDGERYAQCLDLTRGVASDYALFTVSQGAGCPAVSISAGDHSSVWAYLNAGSIVSSAALGNWAKFFVYDIGPTHGHQGNPRLYRQLVGKTSCGSYSLAYSHPDKKSNFCH